MKSFLLYSLGAVVGVVVVVVVGVVVVCVVVVEGFVGLVCDALIGVE